MKTISILIAFFVLASCNKQSTPAVLNETFVTTIDDLTDTFKLHPLATPIISLYDFNNNQDQAATLRLVLITDKKLNPVEQINLSDGVTTEKTNTNDDIEHRERLIYSFINSGTKAISDFHTQYAPKNGELKNSECFATISSELSLLSLNKSSRRILIIFSDLQENEEAYSSYTKDGKRLLQSKPNKVEELLLKRCPLPRNLVGISVYFVYQPQTRGQDILFSEMVGIYKKLLSERGARVIVQATNKMYQQ